MSLGIETAQYVFSLGFSDIDDVLYNSVGSILGALLMARLSREQQMKILQRLGFLLALASVALIGAMLLN